MNEEITRSRELRICEERSDEAISYLHLSDEITALRSQVRKISTEMAGGDARPTHIGKNTKSLNADK